MIALNDCIQDSTLSDLPECRHRLPLCGLFHLNLVRLLVSMLELHKGHNVLICRNSSGWFKEYLPNEIQLLKSQPKICRPAMSLCLYEGQHAFYLSCLILFLGSGTWRFFGGGFNKRFLCQKGIRKFGIRWTSTYH